MTYLLKELTLHTGGFFRRKAYKDVYFSSVANAGNLYQSS